MRYSVEVLRKVDKYLDKLSRQQPSDAEAIENALEELANDARPAKCKQLSGHPGILRVRVGNYRICYQINDDQLVVLVITIGTRDDVYEELRRQLGR